MRFLEEIKTKCDFSTVVKKKRTLHGGDINLVYLIEADQQHWVVKENEMNSFPKMLEKEFRAMQFLRENSPLYYPKMKAYFTVENRQFLVMEYIEEGENSESSQRELGKGLAEQHRISNPKYGWKEDNYIGSLPQANNFHASWNRFYAEERLLPQGKMAFDQGLLVKKDLQQLERLCYLLDQIIPPEPSSLLHGDLWGGNYFISKEGNPVVYDPAVYFGHREIDLSMTQLFGGFSNSFYEAYQETFPLVGGWENRIPFFQLYPNFVHLNLFGEMYLPQIREVIRVF